MIAGKLSDLSPLKGTLQTDASDETATLTDNEKWEKVRDRDSRFDGIFVFAVRSTGVYCNPSCPAKRPDRTHIEFFPSSLEAEHSGFRPCRRCKPNEGILSSHVLMVDRVRSYIEVNLDKKLTLAILSTQAGVSPFHLQRTFKRIIGVSPPKYIQALRLAKVKHALLNGETVTKAIYKAGFSSKSRFYENGPHKLGMNPGAVRRGGIGTKITYTILTSPIGQLLIGGTELGVCAVCIGDSNEIVERALSEQYPLAETHRDDRANLEQANQIMEYLNGRQPGLNLPLDIKGTPFQSRVWQEISSIPYGTTTTYSKIARDLGKPKAIRAVGRACANNPVALVIPCHRVVGKDGKLHGYRWGNDRKRQLLLIEQPH